MKICDISVIRVPQKKKLFAKFNAHYLFLTFLWPFILSAQPANGRQVLHAELIQKSGLNRLSDLFLLADGWQYATIDGFVPQVSVNGLATFQGQQWQALVDGVEMEARIFDIHSLNQLPISIFEVDSIEIFSTPQLHNGIFNERGLIHIHTKKPANGFSAGMQNWIGNETGDPGPYIFTEFATPNVDRVGPDYRYHLAFRKDGFFVQSALLEQNQYFTHRAIRERHFRRNNAFLRTQLRAPSLRIGWENGRHQHRFFAGYNTSADDFPGELLGGSPLFFKPYASEIAGKRFFRTANLTGKMPLSARLTAAYFLSHSQNQLGQNQHFSDTENFDWEMERKSAGLNGQYQSANRNLHASGGITIIRHRAMSSDFPAPEKLETRRLFGKITRHFSKKSSSGIDLSLVSIAEKTGFNIAMHHHWQPDSGQHLRITMTHSRRPPELENSFWQWTQQGYRLAERLGVSYQIFGGFATSHQSSLDASWQFPLRQKTQLTIAAALRHSENLSLESQDFRWNDSARRLTGSTQIHTNENGTVANLRTTLAGTFWQDFRYHGFYMFQKDVSGTAIFRRDWQTLPRHFLRCWMDWQPVKNFSLWAAITYRSTRIWEDYANADGGGNGAFISQLNAAWITDVGFQKYLWQRRIRGNLLFRNLFNGREKSHPLGGNFDLRFFTQIEIYLGN